MRINRIGPSLIALMFGTLVLTPGQASAATMKTTRVSVGTGRIQANQWSQSAPRAVSADGRFVAFYSQASNLVPDDTNGLSDVFVRDRKLHTTSLVSTGFAGQGNSASFWPAISANGRFVAFDSYASNLVPDDTNGLEDVFVRDRTLGTTSRVSIGISGQANGKSSVPVISADGRFVAFYSNASNLVPGDTNRQTDVFVRDRKLHTTARVSIGASGQGNRRSLAPAISADGRFVAFHSYATNLLATETDGESNVFVRDRSRHRTSLVSIGTSGEANGNSLRPAISADGRYVAFYSQASNLVPDDTNGFSDVFVRDRNLRTTSLVSTGTSGEGNERSVLPAISADGRFVAFFSYADNLVSGDSNGFADVFVRDVTISTTVLVSENDSFEGGNGLSLRPAISADGRFIAFESFASNLVPKDSNRTLDVFVRGPYG